MMRFLKLIVLTAALLAWAIPAAQAAGPPIVTSGSFDSVTETSATLHAVLDPNGVKVKDVHFEYITEAGYEAAGNSFGAGTLSTPKQEVAASPAGPRPVTAGISGLAPQTAYRLRAVAENTKSEQTILLLPNLYTPGSPPSFGPCANDPFRLGPLAPLSAPSASMPDCRAYEQASPVDKDGGDVVGQSDFTRAAGTGGGITFGSAFGVPGAEGAQVLPFYGALRGAGGWETRGLLPPASAGAKGRVKGWLPDMSESFAEAIRLGKPRPKALLELHRDGRPATQMTAYAPFVGDDGFDYAGASADGHTVLFEAPAALPAAEGEEPLAGAKEGSSNLYAWDEASGRVHLASVMNTPSETGELLPEGGFAGPYDWMRENPNVGGASKSYYTVDSHAVSADGSAFFTAAGSGQLYERLNPSEPQSALVNAGEPDEECTEPAKACTIHVSGSRRPEPDPQGASPAAFQFASADGSKVFFTSSEELTADANTGPEQPPARIGRATVDGASPPEGVKEDWLPARAQGIAVDPKGEYLYWADPLTNFIGRQRLDSEGNPTGVKEPEYIDTGETEAEVFPGKPDEEERFAKAHSTPRYVAVDDEHVYWTNTGPLGETNVQGEIGQVDGAGTIGRAMIAEPTNVEPEFITGASNPQGIAVNATHIYWANAASSLNRTAIARAATGGGEVEQFFYFIDTGRIPHGVALSPTHVYFSSRGGGYAEIRRIPLDGGKEELFVLTGNKALSLAVDAANVYWADPGGEAIGTIPLADFPEFGGCENVVPSCEPGFIQPSGTLAGVAADGSHLFWSVNGETPPNPGNDLYSYESETDSLTDLTPDSSRTNGAEVQGVLGASEDGSRVYAVANGDLDGEGPGEEGDCLLLGRLSVSGSCGLYRLREDGAELVATLTPGPSGPLAWAGTPHELGASASYEPKTSWVSADGRTLLLYSPKRLSDYDNAGIAQLYRFEEGEPGATCLSCSPNGSLPGAPRGPGLETSYPGVVKPQLATAQTARRILSADGDRAFFETAEALVPGDTNGEDGCSVVTTGARDCQDVYEWEASGTGTCAQDGPGYSPLNEGCVYLISTGRSTEPAYLADASPDGSDVYFFTREQLVGQDNDELYDVYDARVEGGLAAQNPLALPGCEGEGCKGAPVPPPSFTAPPQVSGPGDPPAHRKPCKKTRKKKCKAKKSCKKKKPAKCKGGRR